MLLSAYLVDNEIGFGVSCTRKITTAEEIGDMLYTDTRARVGDLQECIRNVWAVCRDENDGHAEQRGDHQHGAEGDRVHHHGGGMAV